MGGIRAAWRRPGKGLPPARAWAVPARTGRDPKGARVPYNQIMIYVTDTAAEKITDLLTEEHKLGAGLRVFVQGGGCSGFQYGLMIDEGEGDAEADQVFEVNGVRLFVDPISLRYLKGAEVDFVDNNAGGGFTIKNPNAKSTCGCGSSFSA
jgi:iron-sulfur cluster assembly accessory protein